MHCQDTHDALASMDAMVMADDSQQGSPTVASSPWVRVLFSPESDPIAAPNPVGRLRRARRLLVELH